VASKARAPSSAQIDRAYAKAQRAESGGDSESVTLKWRGRTLTFTDDDIGPADDFICRAQTREWFREMGMDHDGYTVTELVAQLQKGGHPGTDVVLTMLWVARRKNGEPSLSFAQAMAEAGSVKQLTADLDLSGAGGAVGEDEPGEASRPSSGLSSPSDSGSTPET
jgi:hypothetical protein